LFDGLKMIDLKEHSGLFDVVQGVCGALAIPAEIVGLGFSAWSA
jgi:hypothetical protein